MLKKWLSCICAAILLLGLGGCEDNSRKVKIGVSIGAGGAARWQKDMAFMQERAKALGADIELRLNLPDSSKTQAEDCLEMLSDGIDVLIITPNNTRKVDDVLMYAKQKNTKVVSYARAVMGGNVDLFVGYDCYKIGQNMGQHLTEKVYHGDIIVLKGDVNDFNTPFLYYGAMKYIKPLIENGKLNMVLDAYVPKWSPAEAKPSPQTATVSMRSSPPMIASPGPPPKRSRRSTSPTMPSSPAWTLNSPPSKESSRARRTRPSTWT